MNLPKRKKNMKLQRKLSNGAWIDIKSDRIEEFITLSIDFETEMAIRLNTPSKTRDEYISMLENGKKLRYDEYWYAQIQDADAIKPVVSKPVEMMKCSCGHTISKTSVMGASLGSSCPECFDRMSA